ncbi:substrate-binding periplasmic protein [Arthrobacter sp. FW306-2-2C-D06B]|uniref:substrate-binding periplasmic protein n=1 Tax=Arthrobacter sp. FW306-2-2C-D06B TaxID=2879618 RepID=UPI001F21D318|nr:ABC transporter substrate-binding protein [Arthrobacter sp. FW306-2-2C-D06B]UKA60516.1 ABC transporter substrate-binding protein [Arthrobacter sp. FW306-2-2C-D06B]
MAGKLFGDMNLVHDDYLTFGGCSGSGPTQLIGSDGERSGFEPAVAEAIGRQLGVGVRWKTLEWTDLYPSLEDGRIDGVFYNQAITPERLEKADFTEPYGVFHEAILVAKDSPVRGLPDLVGLRVGAVRQTTNLTLAEAIPGAEVVPYAPSVEDFHTMVDDVLLGRIDALVDDELFLEQYVAKGYRIAFTVKTHNPYGIAVRKDSALRSALNGALRTVRESGELEQIWNSAFPHTPYEQPTPKPDNDHASLRAILAGPDAIRVRD